MTVHTTFDLSKNHAFKKIKNIIHTEKKISFVTRILIEAEYYADLSIIYFSKIEIHAYIHRHDTIYSGSTVILAFKAH